MQSSSLIEFVCTMSASLGFLHHKHNMFFCFFAQWNIYSFSLQQQLLFIFFPQWKRLSKTLPQLWRLFFIKFLQHQCVSLIFPQHNNNNNNNNNNIFFRSPPSETPIGVWYPPVCGTRDPPLRSDLTAKVYRGVHTLPPFVFEPVTSSKETHSLNH